MFRNPYNIMNFHGVPGARIQALPQNYHFDLTMETWWSAVQRARVYSDFTGLDALYSYLLKSSTLIRSAVDKRLRPLKSRTFAVIIDGREDERLTDKLRQSALVRELIYQKGMANFTFARVIGVNRDGTTYIYPFHTEDTLGLWEPVARDYINMQNAQNNWQTASQFLAYQQMVMYFENGDEEMERAATEAAQNVGLGKVIVSGKSTDEVTGKITKDLELENIYGGASADTFRIFKENIEQLRGSIMLLILGSSLLGMSESNTNSERLVRADLKLFRDIIESDAIDVQDWFNIPENRTKLSYLLNEPALERAEFRVQPSNYVDIGDVDVYTKMLKDLGLKPTGSVVEKVGLSAEDVIIDEVVENTGEGGEGAEPVPQNRNAKRGIAGMAVDFANRILNRHKSGDGPTMA